MRKIPFGCPMIGIEEKEAVLQVLDGPLLTHGPLVKEFEERFAAYTGASYAVATSSCASALHLALSGLGVGVGDEVIVPAQSHVAPAHAVELCGAKPVFVDSEEATGNIDLDRLEDAITKQTRTITVVHYLGMPVDMRRVADVALRHRLSVVEDCAGTRHTTRRGTCRAFRRCRLFFVLSRQAHHDGRRWHAGDQACRDRDPCVEGAGLRDRAGRPIRPRDPGDVRCGLVGV